MKFNSAFFTSLLIFSASQIAMNTEALATEQESAERWFEVEVILFKQLGDKSTLKEKFPDDINATSLPNYPQSFDLLTPYLQPNLTQIKQFMPLCGEPDEQHQYVESLKSTSTPFPEKMQLIEQVAIFNMPDFSEQDTYIDEVTRIDETKQEGVQNLPNQPINNQPSSNENITLQQTEQTEAVTFEFDLQEDTLAKPIFSTQNLCVITQSEIDRLFDKEQLTDFKIDAFGVDSLPGKLYPAGAHNEDSPYLIADGSLLLKDISQSLRWSKTFKPLLHFGWRQVGLTQNEAKPLKLFAGKHYQYQYQQALTAYKKELEQANEIENNLLTVLTQAQEAQISNQALDDTTNIETVNRELLVKTKRKQQVLDALLSEIDYTNNYSENKVIDGNAITDIINTLDKQTLEEFISTTGAELTIDDNQLAINNKPEKPLQPWFLDGFFKVHLDHYLYITTDFNVYNQEQTKLVYADDENTNSKLINFNQNRRVITGEIHYFDHPYIGMIVQIRRFDPTKPADEAVSQAIQ